MSLRRTAHIAAPAVTALVTSAALGSGNPNEMLEQFRDIWSMTVTASVQMEIEPDPETCESVTPGELIQGQVAYWADGSSWRIDSYLDPALISGMNTKVALAGSNFQYLSRSDDVLSISTSGAAGVIGMTLANPLFETLQFLYPITEQNANAVPQLVNIRGAATASTMSGCTWSTVQIDGRTLDRTELPGGLNEGVLYTHRVYARGSNHGRPVRVDRVDSAGKVITRTLLDNYFECTGGDGETYHWPRTVVVEVMAADGTAVANRISFVIGAVTVNSAAAVPTGTFDIPWSEASVVVVDNVVVQGS